jgi:DNA repair exonuclease SbcCD nuclease subunit
VQGASMNDNTLSRRGLGASLFPPLPVWTGHFHKPHTLTTSQGAQIVYVGSPYQVSPLVSRMI